MLDTARSICEVSRNFAVGAVGAVVLDAAVAAPPNDNTHLVYIAAVGRFTWIISQ